MMLVLLVMLTHDIYLTHQGTFSIGLCLYRWRQCNMLESTKQTLVAISLNHAEILTLHDATSECFWLRAVVEHIWSTCRLSLVINVPTTIYEDNVACIDHIKNNTSKETKPSIFHRSSFFPTSSKSIRSLKSNNSDLKTTLTTYSRSQYRNQPSRSFFKEGIRKLSD